MTARTLYLRTDDVEAAIRHGAVTDCVIYSVDDPRVALVPVQVAPPTAGAKPWPIRGVRVDGENVIVSVKGGNDAARWLCGEILSTHAAPAAAVDQLSRLPPLTNDMLRYAMAAMGTGSPQQADTFRTFWHFASEAYATAPAHALSRPAEATVTWREALEFTALTLSSDWPERCQQSVRLARLALRDEEGVALIREVARDMVQKMRPTLEQMADTITKDTRRLRLLVDWWFCERPEIDKALRQSMSPDELLGMLDAALESSDQVDTSSIQQGDKAADLQSPDPKAESTRMARAALGMPPEEHQ